MTRQPAREATGAELYQRMVRRLASQNATIRRLRKALAAAGSVNADRLEHLQKQLDLALQALTMHQDEMQTLRDQLDAAKPPEPTP